MRSSIAIDVQNLMCEAYRDIATTYGRAYGAVYRVLVRHGVPLRARGQRPREAATT
jgi:hypothetical protein